MISRSQLYYCLYRAFAETVAAMKAVTLIDLFWAVPGNAILRAYIHALSAADALISQDPVSCIFCLRMAIGKTLTKDRFLRKIKDFSGCLIDLEDLQGIP